MSVNNIYHMTLGHMRDRQQPTSNKGRGGCCWVMPRPMPSLAVLLAGQVAADVQNGGFGCCWRVAANNTKTKKQATVKTTKDDAAASAAAGDDPTVTRRQVIPVCRQPGWIGVHG